MSDSTDRLVPSPVFVLSAIRSGSTLLRCILNTHSQICAPHELHLADLAITCRNPDSGHVGGAATISPEEATYTLWDRVLHKLLMDSGKRLIVDKTPGNLLIWQDLARQWPEAKYLFLTRHPVHILESALNNRPEGHKVEPKPLVLTYLRALVDARKALPGITVRYEDLTARPHETTQRICGYLNVPWESRICEYGVVDHGPFVFGIGDFTANIRSGRIQASRPLPDSDHTPPDLTELSGALGYLPDGSTRT